MLAASIVSVKTNRMGSAKWNYHNERGFATNQGFPNYWVIGT